MRSGRDKQIFLFVRRTFKLELPRIAQKTRTGYQTGIMKPGIMNFISKQFRFCLVLFVILATLAPISPAKDLRVGVGNFEPFFVERDQSGLFMELTKAVFQQMPQYKTTYIFMSNKRLMYSIVQGKLDVACNIFTAASSNIYLSTPMYRFSDVAISLKKNNFKINSVADLARRSIVAYQGATDLLGNQFQAMARSNDQYLEHKSPSTTTFYLVRERKEVRIGDINIFYHDISQPKYRGKVSIADFSIHRLWPAVYSFMATNDKVLQHEINRAIKTIKSNGQYEGIYHKYKRIWVGVE